MHMCALQYINLILAELVVSFIAGDIQFKKQH